ncbi:MAG: hypothetical protein M0T81_09105 [Thermoplasmatales archaeon]|nr:hypothetical protein [Thermoplasmatales archaeon]
MGQPIYRGKLFISYVHAVARGVRGVSIECEEENLSRGFREEGAGSGGLRAA